MKINNITVCIPAFNEALHIKQIIIETKKVADQIIVCDDGSTDSTAQIAEDNGALVIRHKKNKGYGSAVISLFKEALNQNANIIITMDADMQHSPRDLSRLIGPILSNQADLVIGSRFISNESDVPVWRKFGIQLINSLIKLKYKGITDSQSGYRAYTKNVLTQLSLSDHGMGISTEILLKAKKKKFRIVEVPILIKYYDDSSTHNPFLHGVAVFYSTLKHLFI